MIDKKCKHCGKEFTMKPKTRVQKFCSKKCRERNWRENNREKLNKNVREYRARRYIKEGAWYDHSPKAVALKEWMAELKSKPCTDCGNSFQACCMDFDHIEGTKKSYNVGSMFAHHYSVELIKTELDKCELVCSNCHRIRTKLRKKGSAMENNKKIIADPED